MKVSFRISPTFLVLIVFLVGGYGTMFSQTRLSLGTGVISLGENPTGLGVQYFVDEGDIGYSFRISREVESGSLELSYSIVASQVQTAFRTQEEPDGRLLLSNFFASADLLAHLVHINFIRPIVQDHNSGRSFSIAGGVGIIGLDPGTNELLDVPDDPALPEDIPSEFHGILDFSYSFGAVLRFPFSPSLAVRGEVWDVLQVCEGGAVDGDFHMCRNDRTLHHVNGTVGLEFTL